MKRIFTIMFLLTIANIYSQNPCIGIPTVTYSGKTYNTVQIGIQCWLKENLDIGTMILVGINAVNNGIVEKYCYNNDLNNCNTYGGLYQWNEAMQYVTTPGTQGICPTGWHIPTQTEFQTLSSAVSNNSNALKAIGQGSGSGAGTNTSDFSAMLAGYRSYNSLFHYLDNYTYFWSSTEYGITGAYGLYLYSSDTSINLVWYAKTPGFSIRCVNDLPTSIETENTKQLPTEFSLSQNYPNPFNPTTKIKFGLPESATAKLTIYDLLGREVSTLINGELTAGYHEYEFNAGNLSSGIYFYRIFTPKFTSVKKLLLMK